MKRAAVVVVAVLALAAALQAARVSAHTGALRDSRSASLHPNPEASLIRTQIRDILSAPEYNRKLARPGQGLGGLFGEWLDRLLEWLNRSLSGKGIGHSISLLLAVMVIAAFAGLCVLLGLKLAARMRTRAHPQESDVPEGFGLPSSGRLMAEAEKLAEAGDYRGAFLKAYLGSISYLDEIEALRFERSRTNWEYLRELTGRGHGDFATQLRPLTFDFDRKLYGHDHCTRDDYRRAVRAYEQVRQAAA